MSSADQEIAVTIEHQPLLVTPPDDTGVRVSDHYESPATGENVGPIRVATIRARRTESHPADRKRKGSPLPLPGPEIRTALRRHWKAACEAAEDMVHAAGTGDLMGLGIAADNLDQALAQLWELRDHRDIDWRTILNHVKDMMRQFFARKQAEELSQEQCQNILTIVKDYLGPATKSVADLTEVVRLIGDAGFDPYDAISGDPLPPEIDDRVQ